MAEIVVPAVHRVAIYANNFSAGGQSIQPLVSANHGAGNVGRNRSFFRMGLLTVGVMGIAFCALGEFFPAALVAFFVRATPGLLSAAPLIVRILFAQFPALGFDVLATYYYLQSVMHKKSATGRFDFVITLLTVISLIGISSPIKNQ